MRITFRPKINAKNEDAGLEAKIEIFKYEGGIFRKTRKYNLFKGWKHYMKETGIFLRCDLLTPSYAEDLYSSEILADVHVKIDFYEA